MGGQSLSRSVSRPRQLERRHRNPVAVRRRVDNCTRLYALARTARAAPPSWRFDCRDLQADEGAPMGTASIERQNLAPAATGLVALARQSRDMPWAAANELRRMAALPYIRLMFGLHGLGWGRRWRIFGMPIVQRYR